MVEGIDSEEHYESILEYHPLRRLREFSRIDPRVDIRVFVEKDERERVQDLYARSKDDASRHRKEGFNAYWEEFGRAPFDGLQLAANMFYRYYGVDSRRGEADVIVNSSRGFASGEATFTKARAQDLLDAAL